MIQICYSYGYLLYCQMTQNLLQRTSVHPFHSTPSRKPLKLSLSYSASYSYHPYLKNFYSFLFNSSILLYSLLQHYIARHIKQCPTIIFFYVCVAVNASVLYNSKLVYSFCFAHNWYGTVLYKLSTVQYLYPKKSLFFNLCDWFPRACITFFLCLL